ncbi:hypothetical protein K438DRAFT_725594 [Mycena galopus ATCC 62051]|nr:hypothetical protein K438DRAFT_725594 [Mycena galopus ATCC 62051]
MSLSSASSLLSLPGELRLQIYDAVVDLPLDCKVVRQNPPKRQAAPIPDIQVDGLRVSWLSLVLVCKTIANELQYHICASGNTTYKLEVNNAESQRSITEIVTWRRIPCPPSSARNLQADLDLDLKTRFWGAGGPNPILSELYQVLNCFIHNGPVLARKTPLGTHIHLDMLIVRIRVVEPDPEEQRAKGREPYPQSTVIELKKWLYEDLKRYISRVVDRGLLFGAVDKIVCRLTDDYDTEKVTEWDVCQKTIGDMTEWNTYNFDWGVPGSSSLPEREPEHRVAPTED